MLECADRTAETLGYLPDRINPQAHATTRFYMRPQNPGSSLSVPRGAVGPTFTIRVELRRTPDRGSFLHVIPGTVGGSTRTPDDWSPPAPQAVEYADRLRNQCSPPRVG